MKDEQLKQVLARVFSMDIANIDDKFSIDTVVSWTSLTHSNLIIALEQAFSVRFSTIDIVEMMNYKLIRYILLERLQEASV